MRISDWSSDVCSSDLYGHSDERSAGGRCDTLAGWALDGIRAAGEARSGRCRAAAAWGQQWRQGMAPAAQVGDRCWRPCDRRLQRLRCCGKFVRSEEHTSELQSLMRRSYAVCCLKKKQQE